MRADRLLSILLFMQTRGRTTTDRLAEEFEVSRRTIIRDLYALRVAGFPVYTERGPHGGCYLHEEYRNTLTQLTTDEIAALFLSSIEQPLKDLGLSDPLRAAVLKLTAALPESRREARNRVTERIIVDSTGWEAQPEPLGQLALLHQATMDDRWATTLFSRPFQVKTARRIAPYGLVAKSGAWFVVWAGEDGRIRVDRVSRVLGVTLHEDRFERPDEFDLSAFWRLWRRKQVSGQSRFEVELRARKDAVDFVQDRLGARQGVFYGTPRASDDWVPMRIIYSDHEDARQKILALGGAVEVLSPEALRLSIMDFAEQIRRTYRGDSSHSQRLDPSSDAP